MGWLNLWRRAEKKATPLNLLDRLDGWSAGGTAVSGVVVSELTALQNATVSACVARIASDVASMPLDIRRMEGGNSVPAEGDGVYRLLSRGSPNPHHTRSDFIRMMTTQAVLRGDGLAFITRNTRGRPMELWPLQRQEVGIQWDGYEPTYTISAYDGQISGRFGRENVLHLRNGSLDGKTGLDALLYARNTIGLGLAAQHTQARTFKNGNRMSGYWSTGEAFPADEVDRLAEQLRQATSGDNQGKSPFLDRGVKYHQSGTNFRDNQVVETRRHEMIEVCAAFGVLPAILGIDDKTQAFASVEAMFRAHLVHTLRPWLVAWEQVIDRDLLDGAKGPLFAKFDTSDMEKATTRERAESYRDLAEVLVMMPNEMRRLEGMPEVPGLDEAWLEIRKGMAGVGKDETAEPSDPA